MRATLIHNADARGFPGVQGLEIHKALTGLGWSVTALDAREMDTVVRRPADVVVVAGGDGTVSRVARRVAGTALPIALVPMGTANNVARTLGIDRDPRAAIAAFVRSAVRDVDLGVVTNGDGKPRWFLEGFGVGVFASVMAEQATHEHKRVDRACKLLARELVGYEPLHVRMAIDGRDVSGDFLLVAVLNLRSLGPALPLAPDARFDDALLDVVLVRPVDRGRVIDRLHEATRDRDIVLPDLLRHRGKHVRLGARGRWAHVDDRAWELDGDVDIRVEPRAVRFLLPRRRLPGRRA